MAEGKKEQIIGWAVLIIFWIIIGPILVAVWIWGLITGRNILTADPPSAFARRVPPKDRGEP